MTEHKVKVTTTSLFSEAEIAAWLDEVSSKGWELVTASFFGQGVLWIFRREQVFDQEDPAGTSEESAISETGV